MNTPKTILLSRWLGCMAAVGLSTVMIWMAVQHGLAWHWANSQDAASWQRAADWEPDNPDHWYRLGRYYQVDFENADSRRAAANYTRATTIAPGTARYWLDLAEAQETAMQTEKAEAAFRKARQAYPLSAEAAWRFGNFLLRQGRQDEAYQEIRKALSTEPGLTSLAISRCWQSSQDIEKILNLALPPDAVAYWGAIDFLVEAREPGSAMAVWKRLMASHPTFRLQKSFRLQEMLLETGHAEEAHVVWKQSLAAEGASDASQEKASLIWNGGFEQDLLNGGFGWRFRRIPGVDLSFDPRVVHSGSRSIRMEFDGSSNVDFQQPWQYIVLEPNTHYRLTAYLRTEHLTTSSGVRLELNETHFGETLEKTADLQETQAWAASEIEFTTGADTRLVRLVLRRRPSLKLDNKISGTLWIDDVSLIPLVESSALR